MNIFFNDEIITCYNSLIAKFSAEKLSEHKIAVVSDNRGFGNYITSLLSEFGNNNDEPDTVIYIDDFETEIEDRKDKLGKTLDSFKGCKIFLYISLFSFEKGFGGNFTSVAERELNALCKNDDTFKKACTVLESEEMVKRHCNEIDIRAIRFTNIFGPEIVPLGDFRDIITENSSSKHITVYKDDFSRNFSACYVRSAVETVFSVLFNGKNGNIYHGSALRLNKAELKSKIYSFLKNDGCELHFSEKQAASGNSYLKCDKIRSICVDTDTDLDDLLLKTFSINEEFYTENNLKKEYDGKINILRNAEISMLCEVDRICKKNNINYFLIGGTLLGAHRHSGFIPWDDDIDICMMREDYEKFRKICPLELSEKYAYQSYKDDEATHYIFDKIRLKNTYFSSEHSNKFDTIENGVFLDVFVFDKTSNIRLLQKIHVYMIVMLRRLIHVRWTKEPVKGRFALISKLILPILCMLPFSFYHSLFEKVLRFYENSNNAYLLDGTGLYIKKGGFPIEWMSEFESISFNGHSFPVPKHREKYLKMWYGENFMTPPSVSKRAGHDIARFDLGEYLFKEDGKNEISLKGEFYDK